MGIDEDVDTAALIGRSLNGRSELNHIVSLSTPTWNRVPPSNQQAEHALLGALLANNKCFEQFSDFLRSEHFIDPIHRRIFEVVSDFIERGHLADAVTLKSYFSEQGTLSEVGGTAYLVELIGARGGIINAGDYARVIYRDWVKRELVDIGEVVANAALASDGDPEEIIARALARLDDLNTVGGKRRALVSLKEAMQLAMDAHEDARKRNGPAGLSTGFRSFDDRLGGLEPGLVYVLAGRPGSGKSALGHIMALNVARSGVGVLELSLEMSATQLGRRALAAAARVPLHAMKRGEADNAQMSRLVVAQKEMSALPLVIDDGGGMTASQIAARITSLRRRQNIGLVMVDHLNLVRPDDRGNKHGATWAIEQASATMLAVAKDANIPVLVLAQLNREVEKREDKRPELSDLRQAGALEQDAFAVGFVYRPEYYLKDEPEQRAGEPPGKYQERLSLWRTQREQAVGKAEIIWRKVRDGDPGTDELRFDGPTTSFSEGNFGFDEPMSYRAPPAPVEYGR